MNVKVLGSGCPSCKTLTHRTREALAQLGSDATVEFVDDYAVMAQYRIMSTPALVIDDQLIFNGRVPKTEALVELFSEYGA